MLNAIDEGQEELRYYIEKYSLLQWMNSELFALIDSDISDVIDKSAFCSDEDMDIKDLYRKELKRLYEF